MKSDYHLFLAEFSPYDVRKEASSKSLATYPEAGKVADEIARTHRIRLGRALNFSIHYYEIFNSPERSFELFKKELVEPIDGL